MQQWKLAWLWLNFFTTLWIKRRLKSFVSELVIKLTCGKTYLLSAQRKLITDVYAQSRFGKDRSPLFANGFANFIRAVSYFISVILSSPSAIVLFVCCFRRTQVRQHNIENSLSSLTNVTQAKLKVDFHCRVNFTCVQTKIRSDVWAACA